MSKRFKSMLSILAVLLGFSFAANAEENIDEKGHHFRPFPVVLIECHYDGSNHVYGFSSVTPSILKPVLLKDDCTSPLSELAYFGYEIESAEFNPAGFLLYTLVRD